MLSQETIRKLHCGLIKCPANLVEVFMPELREVMDSFPGRLENFTADVKVHMLMPGQYPCIPNWHYDLVPRDENHQQDFTKIRFDQRLWLWLSNAPVPEFRNGLPVIPGQWFQFSQMDEHRGTVSNEHIWRVFIRLAPQAIYAPQNNNVIRRHCQVYLDASNFKW